EPRYSLVPEVALFTVASVALVQTEGKRVTFDPAVELKPVPVVVRINDLSTPSAPVLVKPTASTIVPVEKVVAEFNVIESLPLKLTAEFCVTFPLFK